MFELLDKKHKLLSSKSSFLPQTNSTLSQGTVQRAQTDPKQLTPSDILGLQGTIGNHRVQRLLSPQTRTTAPVIQRDVETDTDEQSEQVEELVEGHEENLLSESDVALGEGESPGFQLVEGQEENLLSESDVALGEGESPGFQLIDDQSSTNSTAPKRDDLAEYRSGSRAPKKPPKRTIGQKFKSFKRAMKQLVKNQTVHTYGKNGIHALMSRDERKLNKAAQALRKGDKKQARLYLHHVYGVTKQGVSDFSSVGTGIAVALTTPIWFARWQVAHARWLAMAKESGLIAPKTKADEKPQELPEVQAEPQHEWWNGKAQHKDFFGGIHAWMMGGNSAKGRGKTHQQKLHVQQKWRTRELANPEITLGKQRHEGWTPTYSRSGDHRDAVKGVKLGRHRPEWQYGRKNLDPQSKFKIGGHRPVWGFNKPSGEQSGVKLGGHRPVWGFNKPSGDKSGLKLGSHRPDWGFEKPNGDKSGYKLGRHRPIWDYRGGEGGGSGLSIGSHRPVWDYRGKGSGGSGLSIGGHRPDWGFDKPEGERGSTSAGMSGHRRPIVWEEGSPRLLYPPNSVSKELSGHRRPTVWEEGSPRLLYPPNAVPELSSHRNPNESISEPPVEEMVPPTPEVVPEETSTPGGLQKDVIYTLVQPITVKSSHSGIAMVIDAGIQVMISDFGKRDARVDGINGLHGYASLATIESALGIR